MRQKTIQYLRHPNGKGKLMDDSDVSKSAHLSEDSVAVENAVIRDARVTNSSLVCGNARILGGTVSGSFVGGNASISGKAYLGGVVARDNAQIYEKPVILGCNLITVEGFARVYGDTILEGAFTLSGRMRVNAGHWTRAPRFVDLGFEAVTESKLGAMVGCRDRTVDYWQKHGPRLGERWGLSEEQIEKLLQAVAEVTK